MSDVWLHEAVADSDADAAILAVLSMEGRTGLGRTAGNVHAILTGDPIGTDPLGVRRSVAWFEGALKRLVTAGRAHVLPPRKATPQLSARREAIYEPAHAELRDLLLNDAMRARFNVKAGTRYWPVERG